MSLITELRAAEAAAEAAAKRLEALKSNPALQNLQAFESELRELLGRYSMSLKDVNQLLDPEFETPRPKRSLKARQLTRFTNPHNGEVVESYGGINKVLAEWRAQYGWPTVKSWGKPVE